MDKNECLSAEVFSKLKNLRFLKIGCEELNGGHVQLPKGLSYLSNELHVIDWHGYTLISMPTNFQPIKLVKLRMHCSGIKKLWKGIMVRFSLMLICISFVFIKTWVCLIIYWFKTDFKWVKTHWPESLSKVNWDSGP